MAIELQCHWYCSFSSLDKHNLNKRLASTPSHVFMTSQVCLLLLLLQFFFFLESKSQACSIDYIWWNLLQATLAFSVLETNLKSFKDNEIGASAPRIPPPLPHHFFSSLDHRRLYEEREQWVPVMNICDSVKPPICQTIHKNRKSG